MNIREERERNTDRAWSSLHQRLEQDGLLAIEDARSQRTIGRPATLKWVAGIAALFAGVVLAWMVFNRDTPSAVDTQVLHNAKGEPALVTTFEDGSIIYLKEQGSVEYPVRFARDKREISLDGEAFFEVSRNSERPFIIQTRTAVIEVLGTSFNVKSSDAEIFSLAVRTGKVKVTSKKDNRSVYVNAGETALWEVAGLRTLPTHDVGQFNHYLRHIHFKDQTVSDIARIINENIDSVQLKVAPEAGGQRINITFRDNTPEEMAQIICLGFNLELTRQQNILYINRKN